MKNNTIKNVVRAAIVFASVAAANHLHANVPVPDAPKVEPASHKPAKNCGTNPWTGESRCTIRTGPMG